MLDRLGRRINYLRVSVTDRCNLRCVYCKGVGSGPPLRRDELLTVDEIVSVARAAALEGIDRIRLTGGEPLLREDIADLVAALRAVHGITQIAMTTNGLLLSPLVKRLRSAGLSRVNISLDTLRADRFHSVTGGRPEDALRGLEAALAVLPDTKLNVVVLRGVNDDEVGDFALMTMEKEIEVRFIEHMAIGESCLADPALFVSGDEVLKSLRKMGKIVPVQHDRRAGPARRYRMEGARGTIGLITPVSRPFCKRCNRLRLTSEGRLRSCLLHGGEVDVRPILRGQGDDLRAASIVERLRQALHQAANLKPARHDGCGAVLMSKVGG
jgi:cyclic pyranopterin phosphate synthase